LDLPTVRCQLREVRLLLKRTGRSKTRDASLAAFAAGQGLASVVVTRAYDRHAVRASVGAVAAIPVRGVIACRGT